jgi:hypothetical protein
MKKNSKYDLIIIGGGPSALALAHYASRINKKILIIEKEQAIGGCHRVKRVNANNEYLMTEHGPRVYISSFVNFIRIVKDLGYNFSELYSVYNVPSDDIQKLFSDVVKYENIYTIISEYSKFLFNNQHGLNISTYTYLKQNNFSNELIILLDKLCRLSDGTNIEKYSLNKFLQLLNQASINTMYQPKKENDKGIFQKWVKYLENKGVEIISDTKIIKLHNDYDKIKHCVSDKGDIYHADKYILAIPPVKILELIEKSNIHNAFGEYNLFKNWCINSNYNIYITVIFHWDTILNIKAKENFPYSEWYIKVVKLSDFITFEEESSKTVISCGICNIDNKISTIKKSANECSPDEIISELLFQIEKIFGDKLPVPTASIINPNNHKTKVTNVWNDEDTAFVNNVNTDYIDFQSKSIDNLYNLGTHNGKSAYKFTSIETAVANAIALNNELFPQNYEKILRATYLNDLILYIAIFIISIIFLIVLYFISR